MNKKTNSKKILVPKAGEWCLPPVPPQTKPGSREAKNALENKH
jgi:hypothetical protein